LRLSRRSFFLILGVFAVLLLSSPLWLRWLGSALVQTDPLRRADAVLVLGGDYTCGRIRKAGQLVREGYAPRALVSGGQPQYELQEPDMAIQCAVKHGYPAGLFEPLYANAFSTRDEAEKIKPVLEREGVKTVLVVTSDFHTRRAGLLLREVFSPGIEVTMVGLPDPYWSPGAWWKNREGQKTEFYEWSKTIAAAIGW
jgi:uncharacterized SAM-binding protein YcdF (DUF218 family)